MAEVLAFALAHPEWTLRAVSIDAESAWLPATAIFVADELPALLAGDFVTSQGAVYRHLGRSVTVWIEVAKAERVSA
jgi:hypothetical protein